MNNSDSNESEGSAHTEANKDSELVSGGQRTESDDENDQETKTKENEANPFLSAWIKKLGNWFARPNFADYLIALATVAIALTGVYQWKAIRGQLNEMRSSGSQTNQIISTASDIESDLNSANEQNQDALKATLGQNQQVLTHNIQASRLDQRAWVGFLEAVTTDFSENVPWTVTVVFVNNGRTPARNVQSSVRFMMSPVPIRGPSPEEIKQLEFRPAQSISPQGRYNFALGFFTPAEVATPSETQGNQLLVSQYKAIKNRQVFLYYFGIVKYDDIFGSHRETQFCIYLANPDTKTSGVCDSFNDLK